MFIHAYVSRPFEESKDTARMLDAIEAVSLARCSALEVTGILLVSTMFFVQILEGDKNEVEGIMDRITADPRHHDIKTIRSQPIERRNFENWRMVRFGRSTFAASTLDPLFAELYVPGNNGAHSRFDALANSLARTTCKPCRPYPASMQDAPESRHRLGGSS